MAWTSPKTWLSAILSSSDLNTHVRDNLNYLKGVAGFVDIQSTIRATDTSVPGSGSGVEVFYDTAASKGYLVSYTRPSTPRAFEIQASSIVLPNVTGTFTVGGVPFPLTTSSANLGSNTALGAQNNATDLVSISLAAGTWWVAGGVTVLDSAVPADFSARIWDGTTTITSGQASSRGAASNAFISLSGFITLAGTTTVKLTCQDDTAGTGTAQATTPGGSYANATWIRAMRIG